MHPASTRTLSHSATLTPFPSPAPANGTQTAAKPHLTELRDQLLRSSESAIHANQSVMDELHREYELQASGEDPDPQALEPIARELAARVVINPLPHEGAGKEEREFVVLQLLIGDAGGFDDRSIQEVARKLAGLSATIARNEDPQSPGAALNLLTYLTKQYADNMQSARKDDLAKAQASFRQQVSDLGKRPDSPVHAPAFQSLVRTFESSFPKPVPSPVPAPREAKPEPVDRKAATPAHQPQGAAAEGIAVPIAAQRPPPDPQLAAKATAFVEQALAAADERDAPTIAKHARLMGARYGRPALFAMVDATLDALTALPATQQAARRTLTALAWSLASHPAASRDRQPTPALDAWVRGCLEKVEDPAARLALIADIGKAASRDGRGAVASLRAAIEREAGGRDRSELLAALPKPPSFFQALREPRTFRLPALQAEVILAQELHEAIERSPTAAGALEGLLLPGELQALRETPATFGTHARHVLDRITTMDRATALTQARACIDVARTLEPSVPKGLRAVFAEFRRLLQEKIHELENANSPAGLAEAGLLQPARPQPPVESEVIAGLADLIASTLQREEPGPTPPAQRPAPGNPPPALSQPAPVSGAQDVTTALRTPVQVQELIEQAQASQAAFVIDMVARAIISAPRVWSGQAFARICSALSAKFGSRQVDAMLPAALVGSTPPASPGPDAPTAPPAGEGERRAAGFALSLVARRSGLTLDVVENFLEAVLAQPQDEGFLTRLGCQLEELGQVLGAGTPLERGAQEYIALHMEIEFHGRKDRDAIEALMTRALIAGAAKPDAAQEKAKVARDARQVHAAIRAQEALLE